MSDLIERLNDDVRQLTKMVEHAKLAGPETGVRVKDPSLLLADLSEAASRISQQDDELERMRREVEALQQTVDFVVRQAWREDPPNANNKLTDSERLSAIKFYPRIKQRWESEQ